MIPGVTDCRDCPLTAESRSQGECFTFCNHPGCKRDLYENILWGCQEDFTATPKWCPMGLGADNKEPEKQTQFESYVWDPWAEAAPTEDLQKMTKNCMSEIQHQPYFGKSVVRHSVLIKQQQEMNELYRYTVDQANSYISGEDKMPNRKNKCTNRCASYAAMETSVVEPETCQTCSLNPSFVDNFEQKQMPWPPEKGQEIWCISATGQVHERDYDSDHGPKWDSLVMCYVNEGVADGALETLLKARGMANL